MGETQSPLPEKSRVETFSWPTQALPPPGDSPHPGKKWLHRPGPQEREVPQNPRRKDNSELASLFPKCYRSETPRAEMQGRLETSLPRHASEISPFPGKRDGPRLTCLKYSQEPWEENRLPESLGRETCSLGPQWEYMSP